MVLVLEEVPADRAIELLLVTAATERSGGGSRPANGKEGSRPANGKEGVVAAVYGEAQGKGRQVVCPTAGPTASTCSARPVLPIRVDQAAVRH
jgi:hypothetical protein